MSFFVFYLILIIFAVIAIVLKRFHRLVEIIPGPKRWPIVGNSFDIVLSNGELFKFIRHMHRTYGDLVSLWGFHQRAINVYNPNDAEVVLSSFKFIEKQEPYTMLRPWLCQGLLVSNGSKWQERRKLLTPAFHFNILKQFSAVFNKRTQEFLSKIQKEVDKDKTDPMSLITEATLSIMCETSMGTPISENYETSRQKYFQAVHILGECVVLRISRLWLQLDWLFSLTPSFGRQKTALKDVRKFTNDIIKERRNSSVEVTDANLNDFNDFMTSSKRKATLAMLDLLLKNEREGKIDNNGIREEVDTFMFEGHDTTAMALYFMIIRLANEPQIQEKIFEELDEIFGDSRRDPTMEDINDMKYLECCIKESLRIYPSVPLIARRIKEDVVLSGYKVPAQSICVIHIYDIHHRADVFPDPERFIPERFLPHNENSYHPYAYIPFSAGPRNCIGKKFAMIELKTMMSGLLRRFRLEPVTKAEDLRFTMDLVLRPLNPGYVKFRNRHS